MIEKKVSEIPMDIIFTILLVAIGGALGAVLRYAVGVFVYDSEGIPWNTFIVNFVGCFLICLIFFGMDYVPNDFRAFLFIGVFGAFTTMSSLTLETIQLFTAGAVGIAVANYLFNTVLCLAGGFLGRWLALMLM